MSWIFGLFFVSVAVAATLTTNALAQWSIGQPGTREPPQGQNRYVYLVMSDPLPGREFEFNDGYATATLAHSLKMTLTPISLLSTPRPSTSFGPRPRAPNTCQLEAAYPGPAFIGTGLGRAPDGSSCFTQPGPEPAENRWAEHVRSARVHQMSTCSSIKASRCLPETLSRLFRNAHHHGF